MFNGSYFGTRYFNARYFAKVGDDPAPGTGNAGNLLLLGAA